MTALQRFTALAARLALAAIFVHSGFAKLADPAGTAAFIASKGLPTPMLLAVLAGGLELGAGLLLATGWKTRWAAAALALFLVPTTYFFHNPAGLPAAQAMMQEVQVYKNLAIVGGLLAVAAWGAGALSVDAAAARREERMVEPESLRRAA